MDEPLVVDDTAQVVPVLAAVCGLTIAEVRAIFATSSDSTHALERFKKIAADHGYDLMIARGDGTN